MGVWKSQRGHVSDDVADYLDIAIKRIGKCWRDVDGKKIPLTMTDLADAIEFCSRGFFKVEFHPDIQILQTLNVKDLFAKDIHTIKNRGQMNWDEEESDA